MAKATNFDHRIPRDTALFLLEHDLLDPRVTVMCKEWSDEPGYFAGVGHGDIEELKDGDHFKTFELWVPELQANQKGA